MADIDEAEIKRWLESTDDPASDIASRAYGLAKLSPVGGERPKWCRGEWHNLPTEYREFLVSIARLAIANAKHCQP